MSVYNHEEYVADAVNSILNQTFTDFEYIIINDGSTDRTADILHSYDDPRLQIVDQENIGLTPSLNRGLSMSKGEYIARMDSDDISLPERFERQIDFLDANQATGVLGTACLFRDEIRGTERKHHVVTAHEELQRSFIKGNPFIHSTVMMNTSLVRAVGGYDESYPYIQDYDLWIRLASKTRLANLPDVLLIHREHWDTVTMSTGMELKRLWLRIWLRYRAFQQFDHPVSDARHIFQPVVFTLLELRPKLRKVFRYVNFHNHIHSD